MSFLCFHRSGKRQIFYGFVFLTFFVISSAYQGSLVSVLTTDLPSKQHSTIQELAQNNFTIGSMGVLLCSEMKSSQNVWINQLGKSCQGLYQGRV